MSSILPRKGCSDKEGERAITLRPTVKGSQWMGLPTTAFEAARAQQEKIVQTQPDYGPALCVLGLIDAVLGRKELALHEGRRAIALTPLEKDVLNGSRVLQYFAITAAWAGDKELALQQLEAGLRAPVASFMLSYGALKLHPLWDPLRGDPRFKKKCRLPRAERCEVMTQQSENRKSSPRLSTDGLVMAEAAFPHEARPQPREQEPAGLDRQRLHKIRPF